MPSKNSQKYRTKSKICEDVAHILSAPLHYGTKHAVLKNAAWVWSTFEGNKLIDCRYRSIAANNVMGNQKRLSKDDKALLTHDHVVPKSLIIKMLLELPKPTRVAVERILNEYCVGAAITKEEDKKLNNMGLRQKMPDNWNGRDIWARYHSAKISIKRLQE